MTDPSFARQLITFTTAHVGNYGVSAAAWESDRIHAAGAIMREAINTDRRARRRAGLARLAGRARRSRASPGSTRARSSGTSAPRARCAAGSSRPRCPRPRRTERVRAEPTMVGRDLAREVTLAGAAHRRRGRRPADRRARHRHQALDRPQLRRARRSARAVPLHDAGRRAAGARPRRLLPRARAGRPGGARLRRRHDPRAARAQAGVRDLPRPPAALARGRAGDVQAAVRPPRRQPPGQGPRDRPDRDHLAEPRLRGGRRARRAGSSPSSAPPS